MRLEDLTITLRPRQPWEAVDLGCTLVRRDYGRILLLWLITVLPLWVGLAALLWEYPLWYAGLVWWLKPLYDRLPLYHLSRAAFGARPTLQESLRAWPGLWSRFLFSALILRRLSFIRSFALPVWMLEGQRGSAVRKRVTALATDGGSSGATLTWVFVKLELAVATGILFLVSTLSPTAELPDFEKLFMNPESFMSSSQARLWGLNLIYLLAMTMMEPFYVGGGFGLYLNSRIKIEGWDIELTFRRLATRLRPAVTAAVLALSFLLSVTGMAQQTEAATQDAVTPVLEEVMSRPVFKEHSREQRVWIPDDLELKDLPDNLSGATHGLGMVFYGIAIVIVAVLLGLAIRWLVQNQHLLGFTRVKKTKAEPVAPRVVMGLDIARESLPDDIVSAARSAWQAGHVREALSLLYRGSLSRLVEQRRLPIRSSDTEDDCLMKVANLGDATVTDFFRELTLIWVRAAYAGVEAGAAEFDRLCRAWPFINGPAPRRKSSDVFTRETMAMALLLILPCLSACNKGHWEEIDIPTGYKGKARTDPFLAAQMLLQEMGHETERKPSFSQLPSAWDGGTVFLSGESGIPEARARQLLDWVEDGGHLVYALAGCAAYNDWGFTGTSTYGYAGNEDRADPILEKLGVEVVGKEDTAKTPNQKDDQETPAEAARRRFLEPEDVPTTLNKVVMGEETFDVEIPSMHWLSLQRMLKWGESHAGTLEKSPMLSLRQGQGRVTVISHARPFRNRYLDEKDHARWLVALVGEEPAEVHFIVTLQSSFWTLLWSRAWMPLVGLALVTLIWLWLNMPRFGPMRQVELHETKHFTEHISALGQFFYRLKRSDVLLSAAADAVRAKAIRKHPYLIHLDDEALVQLLTEATLIPMERIRAALVPAAKVPSHEMVKRLQDLQALKTALG